MSIQLQHNFTASANAGARTNGSYAITADNLNVYYGSFRAVRDVSASAGAPCAPGTGSAWAAAGRVMCG